MGGSPGGWMEQWGELFIHIQTFKLNLNSNDKKAEANKISMF